MRLLLIEDNRDLAQLLAERLVPRGLDVDIAHAGEEGLAMAELVEYAAVLLDLGLPDIDGLQVLKRLRAQNPSIPILILTARGQVQERVAGLEAGADDYLVKPFAFEEVIARVQAVLRRQGQAAGERLQVGNLVFDSRHRAVEVNGSPQALSAQELKLLEILMRRAGRVVSKRHLDDQLFGLSTEVGANALEVAIHRLRRRLQACGAQVEIHTIRGVGYLLSTAGAGSGRT